MNFLYLIKAIIGYEREFFITEEAIINVNILI